jgi:gamma-glutamyltranspeptidase/glutathione hydrolase
MAVLEAGGNAFDAAAAAGFVLQVVEPHLCGPGGEVPAIFAARDGNPRVLCGQGVAPAAATIEHLRDDLELELIPGAGLLPATVPGAWDGWLTLLRDYGTFSLRDVLKYAIGYARHGFPLVERIPATIAAVERLFRQYWPTSAALWLSNGMPQAGSRFANPTLAATWDRLLNEAEASAPNREAQIEAARRAWRQGFVAEAIAAFARTPVRDDSGRDHAGLLTADDIADWQAEYDDPVSANLDDGWTLHKIGPWSQGPVLIQQLRMLEATHDTLSYIDGLPSADVIHTATEAAKLAFADREAWYGDDHRVPIGDLLSREYATTRLDLVASHASLDLRPGQVGGRDPRLPSFIRDGRGATAANIPEQHSTAMGIGEPTVSRTGNTRGDTVHIDVVDRWGNIISATPSGGWLQSSPTIPALGFCLGTRGQMFWLEEGLPNSLAPGKRPRITLSPSLASRGETAVMAFGTPGGDQQDQWQLCFWLAHTSGRLNLQAAIDAPAWHSNAIPSSFSPRTWRPGELCVESRVGTATLDELRRRGHQVVDSGPWALGRLSAVSRDPETGLLRAASNPRGAQGYAAGR